MRRFWNLDRLGIGLSMACALHCLATPVLFALLPALGMALHSFQAPLRPWAIGLLRLQAYDRVLIAVALAIAVLSLILGWRRHRSLRPVLWLALAAVAFGLALTATRTQAWLHLVAGLGGSVLLLAAHLENLRRLHPSRRA